MVVRLDRQESIRRSYAIWLFLVIIFTFASFLYNVANSNVIYDSVLAVDFFQPTIENTSLATSARTSAVADVRTNNASLATSARTSTVTDTRTNASLATSARTSAVADTRTRTDSSTGIFYPEWNDTHLSPEKRSSIKEFERQEGVVIVTKLHGPHQLLLLEQSLCLLHFAYNHLLHYDILVFTAIPLEEAALAPLRKIMAPVKFTVVVDNEGLQNEIANLSPVRREKFFKRCKPTAPENITWETDCDGRINYNWQAEFRSWHIWRHPALRDYKYMMWLDTDGYSTRPWTRDPVAVAMQNDLVIMFDHWPQGNGRGRDIQERIVQAFGQTLCGLEMKDGQMQPSIGGECPSAKIPLVHGFFHVTNLDFFRSDAVTLWGETLIGDCYLCRKYDDQVAVTVAPAMLAPHRAWDMRSHGLRLDVFHNSHMDGQLDEKTGNGFLKWWKISGRKFPQAHGICPIKANG
jgi:hypothetical protein